MIEPSAQCKQDSGSRRAGLRRSYLAAGVLGVLVTLAMIGKFLHSDLKDAPVWYDVGRRVLSGSSLVGLASYRYPPTFAVLIAPLCALPFGVFFFLWYAINVGLFALTVRQAGLIAGPSNEALKVRWYWVPAAIMAVYAIDNLFLSQTNILVMAIIYASFLALARGREWRAGLLVGAAIAIKVFPAPLLGYLLYRWRLRALAAALLSCAFFLLALPGPVRGFGRNFSEVREWGQRVVEPYLSRGQAGDWGQHALDFGNQSLQAVAHRYLTRVDANVAARRGAPIYVNVADLTESYVNVVVLAAFALLGLIFIWACGWRRAEEPRAQAVEFSLAVILLLLVSALAWTYFFVMLLLPVAAAVGLLGGRDSLSRVSAGALWFALGAVVLATVLLASHYLRALGSVCFASVALYLALAYAGRELRGTRRGPGEA